MKISRMISSPASAALALLGTTGLRHRPQHRRKQNFAHRASAASAGLVCGYLLGGLIGGKTARIVGAGIGGAAGGYVGYQMDEQISELEESTAGSGVDVNQTPDGDGDPRQPART